MHLVWDAVPGENGYFVYVGRSPDLAEDNIWGSPFPTLSPSLTFCNCRDSEDTTPDLNFGQTYYWRVDTKNEAGITQGNVWSFTTARPGRNAPFLD